MTSWSRHEVTPPAQVVYEIPQPACWNEFANMLQTAHHAYKQLHQTDNVYDNAILVSADEEKIYIKFDKP